MQELRYAKEEFEKYKVPEGVSGVIFGVSAEKELVILEVDGQKITMTVQGARDLAYILRVAANEIERENKHHAKILRKSNGR